MIQLLLCRLTKIFSVTFAVTFFICYSGVVDTCFKTHIDNMIKTVTI